MIPMPIACRKTILDQFLNDIKNGEDIACPEDGWTTNSVLALAGALHFAAASHGFDFSQPTLDAEDCVIANPEPSPANTETKDSNEQEAGETPDDIEPSEEIVEEKIPVTLCPFELIARNGKACWYGGDILETGKYGVASAPVGQELQPLPYDFPNCTVDAIPLKPSGGSVFNGGSVPSADDAEFEYGPNVIYHPEKTVRYTDNFGFEHYAKLSGVLTERGKEAIKMAHIGVKITKDDGAEDAEWKATNGNHNLIYYDCIHYDIIVS